MGRAILASAAISGLVPADHGRRRGRDGRRLGAELPVRARVSQPRRRGDRGVQIRRELSAHDLAYLERTRASARAVPCRPPVRALLAEVRLAQERSARGEPAHYGELIVRLMRVAFARNAVVEERIAGDRETSVAGAATLRARTSSRHRARGSAALAPEAAPSRARVALRRGALPVPPRPPRADAHRPRDSPATRPRSDLSKATPVAGGDASARSSSAATR